VVADVVIFEPVSDGNTRFSGKIIGKFANLPPVTPNVRRNFSDRRAGYRQIPYPAEAGIDRRESAI
jgi:hypothetical protein